MRGNRVGSLGRRLSGWLALQSLIGLVAVCAAVYAVTVMSFQARQSETLLQKEAQVRHLIDESAGEREGATLRHKLDDFLVGHQNLSLQLYRSDGTTFYAQSRPQLVGPGMRELRFTIPKSASGGANIGAVLTFDTREEAVAYAEKQGLPYRVEEPKPAKRRLISYSDNFRFDRRTPWTH